jgi:hypothetical protein
MTNRGYGARFHASAVGRERTVAERIGVAIPCRPEVVA